LKQNKPVEKMLEPHFSTSNKILFKIWIKCQSRL